MMQRKKLRLGLVVLLGLASIGVPLFAVHYASAEKLSNIAPNPDSSHWANVNSDVGHLFYMRKANAGNQSTIRASSYYLATNDQVKDHWDDQFINITSGGDNINNHENVCDISGGPQSSEQYIIVTLDSRHNDGGGGVVNYRIPHSRVCMSNSDSNDFNVKDSASQSAQNNNEFYGLYKLPTKPTKTDSDSGDAYYRVDVTVTYGFNVENDSWGNSVGALRFLVRGGGGANPKIGPTAGDYGFSILAPWKLADDSGPYAGAGRITVPFGMQCDATSPDMTAKVGLYDADNGGDFPATVKFSVKDITTGNFINFNAGDNTIGYKGDDTLGKASTKNPPTIEPGSGGEVVVPGNGNAFFTWGQFKLKKGDKYILIINGISPKNTIDVRVPGGTIYGDEDTCKTAEEKWNIQPDKSTVYDSDSNVVTGTTIEVERGKSATFRWAHSIKNVGKDDSEKITASVKWGTTGVIPTTGNVVSPTPRIVKSKDSWSMPDNTYTVAISSTASIGSTQQYCQYATWSPDNWNDDPTKVQASPALTPVGTKDRADPVCVTVKVIAPTPVACPYVPSMCPSTQYVSVTPSTTGGAATETLGTASFNGQVYVSNFPTPTQGGWGYNEKAIQRPAVQQYATVDTPGTRQYDSRQATASASYGATAYSCAATGSINKPNGNSARQFIAAASTSKNSHKFLLAESQTPPATSSPTGTCYRCDGTPAILSNGTCYYSYAYTEYRYQCVETGAVSDWGVYPSCRDHYTCPNGSTVVWIGGTGGWFTSAVPCNAWKCQYPDAQIQNATVAPPCAYRCSSGYGTWAKNDGPNDTAGTGDLRCFIQPSFTLTCTWDTGAITYATVQSNGTYCNSSTTRSAGSIGSVVCARLSVNKLTYSSSWQPSSPLPGYGYEPVSGTYRQLTYWFWNIGGASQSCNSVVGMPYFKVFGGDVRVGGGVGSSTVDVCGTNNTATIKGQNRGSSDNYAGSGVQHAAFSNGFISQFVSGQYNRLSANTQPPTGLTFANNAGGGGYGGGFADGGGCNDYLRGLPSDTENTTGDKTIGSVGLLPNEKLTQHVVGNVYITGNITYGTTWASVRQIPLYSLIVEGNIYIDANVTQLDGLYVALPNAAGTAGGHIYTCATGMGSLPSNTFTGCKKQLVVNGAFAAKQVHLLRDCGSLVYSTSDSGTVYSGGTDDQVCNPTNHAAEVFNYGPEQWIRAAAGFPSDNYDAISSMPPVL